MYVKRHNVDEFNKEIMQNPGLIEYYLPQCKHCQDFAPEWSKMCMEIQKDYDGNVVIAAIDCSEPQTMEDLQCHKDVGAFPTVLKMDRGEKIKEYGGVRTKDALMEFILREFDMQPKKSGRSKRRHSRKKFSKKEKRGGGHKRIRKTLRKRKGGRHRNKSKTLKKPIKRNKE